MLNLLKLNEQNADATAEVATPMELNVELMPHQKRALFWMSKRENPVDLNDLSSSIRDCRGGILSDDQGLGKTLTMLGLCYHNAPDDRQPWRILIVCPLSLVNQWKHEIESRVHSRYRRSVYVYHGANRTKDPARLKSYDFVITTYQILANEYAKVLTKDPRYEYCREAGLEPPTRRPGAAYRLAWNRVILDEAHQIRNRSTDAWKSTAALNAKIRWALSGTPILNEISDIFSLTEFIRYHFVENVNEWNWKWKRVLESKIPEVRERGFKRFQTILGVVLLRRAKTDKIDGKPLIVLPEREVIVLEEQFEDPEEIALYKAVETKSVIQFNKFLMSGTVNQNYTSVLLLLLRLRQAVCHPFLIEYTRIRQGIDENGLPDEALEKAVSNTQQGISIRNIIENLYTTTQDDEEESGDDVAYSDDDDFIDDRPEYEIMEEVPKVVEEEVVGNVRKKARMIIVSDSEDDDDGVEEEKKEELVMVDDAPSELGFMSDSDDSIQLVAESGPRLMQNPVGKNEAAVEIKSDPHVIDICSPQIIRNPAGKIEAAVEIKNDPQVIDICSPRIMQNPVGKIEAAVEIKNDPQVIDICSPRIMHNPFGKIEAAFEIKNDPQVIDISMFDDDEVEILGGKPNSPFTDNMVDVNEVQMADAMYTPQPFKLEKKVLQPAVGANMNGSSDMFLELENVDDMPLMKMTKAEEKKMKAERMKNAVMQPSRKIKVLIQKLEETRAEEPLRKSLVFSQWTSCLDIIECHLDRAGFQYTRLDGGMDMKKRNKAIKDFRDNPKKLVFLISLHAGGTGLNLTFASQVFIFDVWWNMAKEEQAIDRVHRIGQTRGVRVFRFRMQGTVEDKLYEICERKRETVAGALGEEGKQTLGRQKLTMEDIMGLFSSAAENVIHNDAAGAGAAAARSIIGRTRY